MYKTIFMMMIVFVMMTAQCATAEMTVSPDPYANETKEEHDARMQWWREAKFGMFIHWGVYAVPAGIHNGRKAPGYGEWIMDKARIPIAEYKEYAKQFNPTNYDPESWARLAKQAGMKYVVITAKHHDGFSLYDSEVTDWDIGYTPYKKDLLKPLVRAVVDEGLKMGFYYSQAQDWCHPGGANWRGNEKEGHWDEAQKGDMDKYINEIAVPQVREILSGYDIDILWWDTPKCMNRDRAAKLVELLKLRPGIIHNNRLGGGFRGDTETPEQQIPATGYADGRDWETCMTLNGTWGYRSDDTNWKSTETLIKNLVNIVSKGGNYLLNVGPKADGTIPEESIRLLREIGEWMNINGEAIYSTKASPCEAPSWGRITRKDGDGTTTLYLHVFDWPADDDLRVNLDNEVNSCTLLASGDKLNAKRTDDGIIVQCKGQASDAICSVIKMEIEGIPVPLTPYVTQKKNGTVDLSLEMAKFYPEKVRNKPRIKVVYGGDTYIENWKNPESSIEWLVQINKAGSFNLSADIDGKGKESVFKALAVDESGKTVSDFSVTVPSGRTKDFEAMAMKVDKPGVYKIRFVPDASKWNQAVLREMRLVR